MSNNQDLEEIWAARKLLSSVMAERDTLRAQLEAANERAFMASEAHVATMQRTLTAEAKLAAADMLTEEMVVAARRMLINVSNTCCYPTPTEMRMALSAALDVRKGLQTHLNLI